MLRKTSKASGASGSRRPGTMRGLLRRTLGDGGDLRTLRASVRDVFRRGSKQEDVANGEGTVDASKDVGQEILEGTPVTSDRSSDAAEDSTDIHDDGSKECMMVSPDKPRGVEAKEMAVSTSTMIDTDTTVSSDGGAASPRPRRVAVARHDDTDLAESKLKASGDEYDGTETLSRNHPVFEMLRQRKSINEARALEAKEASRSGLSDAATPDKVAATSLPLPPPPPTGEPTCTSRYRRSRSDGIAALMRSGTGVHLALATATLPPPQGHGLLCPLVALLPTPVTAVIMKEDGGRPVATAPSTNSSLAGHSPRRGCLDRLVLKFTTYSQSNETASFIISKEGGTIGRESGNTVSIPTDVTLQGMGHAVIDFKDGHFYLANRGPTNCAAIRIASGLGQRGWPLPVGSAFSAGNSVFVVKELYDRLLIADVIDGPLKGQERKVPTSGATLGRSPDNTLSISDPELSRRHSKIEFEERDGKYYLCDVGSTNGTYIQLIGPYAGTYKLTLSDQIMVGRTGFSINRFDYGISEERGRRKTMEDHTVVIQDLGLASLEPFGLAPQTMAAVFDGHGGEFASAYLSTHLHVNLSKDLEEAFVALAASGKTPESYTVEELDALVSDVATRAFVRTDEDFLERSPHPEAGSTATVTLILGKRVYSCNVGDSRTIVCRNGQLHLISKDHKPGREDEARRIKEAGGFIFQNRVMGELAVSRAFGDKELKKCMPEILGPEEFQAMVARDARSEQHVAKDYTQPLLIARPEILTSTLTDRDDFLLLACDGLFDVFGNDEVLDFVRREMAQHGDCQRTCENLSHAAIHTRVAHDNVSIVLLILNQWW